MAKIFVMVNPWVIRFCEEILRDIDDHGTMLRRARVSSVPEETIRRHYAAKIGQPYFEPMISDIAGRKVEIAVYEGYTTGFNRLKPAIRERYRDRFAPAPDFTRHAVHFSDCEEAAAREIEIWSRFFES